MRRNRTSGLLEACLLHIASLSSPLGIHDSSCNCSTKTGGAGLDLASVSEKLLMLEAVLAGTDVTFVCLNDANLHWRV